MPDFNTLGRERSRFSWYRLLRKNVQPMPLAASACSVQAMRRKLRESFYVLNVCRFSGAYPKEVNADGHGDRRY